MAAPTGGVVLTPQFNQANKGATGARPAHPAVNDIYYDTTLAAGGKPIWCQAEFDPSGPTAAVWVDATGTVV
jgi:hypothetical protein